MVPQTLIILKLHIYCFALFQPLTHPHSLHPPHIHSHSPPHTLIKQNNICLDLFSDLCRFRKDLKTIGVIIEERNATRTYPYPYLHPKEVTNSIGI